MSGSRKENGVRSSSVRHVLGRMASRFRPAIMRGALYRLASPLLFRRLGAGAQIFGSLDILHWFQDIRIGRDAMLGRETFWQVGAAFSAGDRFSINRYSVVVANVGVVIGDNVAIGEFVSIRDQEHRFDPECGVRGTGYIGAAIVIEDNCWIGRGAYIGPGAHIRRGSIVAANAVVRGEFPPNSLIAGAPAAVKKSLAGPGGCAA